MNLPIQHAQGREKTMDAEGNSKAPWSWRRWVWWLLRRLTWGAGDRRPNDGHIRVCIYDTDGNPCPNLYIVGPDGRGWDPITPGLYLLPAEYRDKKATVHDRKSRRLIKVISLLDSNEVLQVTIPQQ